MAAKRPQEAPKMLPRGAQEVSKRRPRQPKRLPREAQDSPRGPQERPKSGPRGSKMVPSGSGAKMAAEGDGMHGSQGVIVCSLDGSQGVILALIFGSTLRQNLGGKPETDLNLGG